MRGRQQELCGKSLPLLLATTVYSPEWPGGWAHSACVPVGHPAHKGKEARTGSIILGVTVRTAQWVRGKCDALCRRYGIVAHVLSCFLQMFMWESFSVVAAKLMN